MDRDAFRNKRDTKITLKRDFKNACASHGGGADSEH